MEREQARLAKVQEIQGRVAALDQVTQNLSLEHSKVLNSNSGGACSSSNAAREVTPRSPDLSMIEGSRVQDPSESQVIAFSDGQISHPVLPL